MNNDLISRSALKAELMKRAVSCPKSHIRAYGSCISALEVSPAVDAEPVQHGHWDDSFDGITPYCSVCGMSHNCINRTPDYCPHCGAKMEGGANDGQNPQMEDETD